MRLRFGAWLGSGVAIVLAVGMLAPVSAAGGAPRPAVRSGPAHTHSLLRPHEFLGPDSYWMVGADGRVYNYGDAAFDGDMGGKPLNKPVVGMAPTPDDGGYWLVASDGGIFTFGDAVFQGGTGGQHLNRPIVGMAPT